MQTNFSSFLQQSVPNPNQIMDTLGNHYLKSFQLKEVDTLRTLSNVIVNLKASHLYFIRLYIIEHLLRRKLGRILVEDFGGNWYSTQGVILHTFQRKDIEEAKRRISSAEQTLNQHTISSFLPFGFWCGFFTRTYTHFWQKKKRIKRVLDKPTNLEYVIALGKDLKKANQRRNQIAHHAPCVQDFPNAKEEIQTYCQFLEATLSKLSPSRATSLIEFVRIICQ